jgi:hypothetical protein
MDPKVKALWVPALRSDKYIQGRSQLCAIDRLGHNGAKVFCCMGVLADVMNVGWQYDRINDLGMEVFKIAGTAGASGHLPHYLLEEFGIPGTYSMMLVEMNDTMGKSFEQIADYIEENL